MNAPVLLPVIPANALKGVLLVIAATLAFAVSDVLTKYLAMRYPVPVVIAVRYLVNLALLAAVFLPKHGSRLWRTKRTGLVILRGGCLAVASLTMGLALQLMPVGETVAIIYLAPFAVMLLAIPLLGERASLVGWIGASAGFLGVLLIVRPGSGLAPLGVVFAVANAAMATAYHLLTRILARTETTMAMLFYSTGVGVIVFCVLAVGSLEGFSPTAPDFGLIILLGVSATIGHFLFTAAYREAPASLLAPANYMHMAWAGGLGWLVFSHIPDSWSLTGMILIAVAGAAVAIQAHFGKQKHAH